MGTGLLHIANYGKADNTGTYTAYRVNLLNGEIKEKIFTHSFGDGSNFYPDRQAKSHPHGVAPFKNFIYVADLGADKIWHFKVK